MRSSGKDSHRHQQQAHSGLRRIPEPGGGLLCEVSPVWLCNSSPPICEQGANPLCRRVGLVIRDDQDGRGIAFRETLRALVSVQCPNLP